MLKWAIRGTAVAAGGLVAAAVAWWGFVYYGVFVNTGVPLTETAPCLLYTSDRCSLAMALCGGQHFLGLTRYSAELLWFGLALASISLVISAFRNGAGALSGRE